MKKLKALDIFCGGGVVCIGLQQAGYEVTGIDIDDHPNYPGTFIQDDVMNLPKDICKDYDFVWASPPCQKFSTNTPEDNRDAHPDFIPLTRELLASHDYTCIENVPGAPIRTDLILSAPMFDLPYTLRKRHFELSYQLWQPQPIIKNLKQSLWTEGKALSISTSMAMPLHYYPRRDIGMKPIPSLEYVKYVMGIPQKYEMTKHEIGEAIPCAFSLFISLAAKQLMTGETSFINPILLTEEVIEITNKEKGDPIDPNY